MHKQEEHKQSPPDLYTQFPVTHDDYSEQIKQQYFPKPETKNLADPFVAIHSDYLHLEVREDGHVMAKSTYYENDIILEVRGKVTTEDKIRNKLEQIGKYQKYNDRYGVLLWLDLKKKLLLKPQGLSQILISSSLLHYQSGTNGGNCHLEQHYGSKLFIRASGTIAKEQRVILKDQSLHKFKFI